MKALSGKRKVSKEMTLTQKAELALKAAVKKTMAEHKKRGEPVAVWKDGKAIWLPADEIKT